MPAKDYYYVKHYISDSTQDILILLQGGGNQDIYVGFTPKQKMPVATDNSTYVFTTVGQTGSGYNNAKSIFLA